MKTQKQQIREYLEAGNSITQLAALNDFGCMRLADVIFKIRNDYQDEYDYRVDLSIPLKDIKTEMIRTAPSKFSKTGKLIAKYSLIKFD